MSLGRRGRAKLWARAAIDAATGDLERGAIGEAEWSRRVTDALAAAYLIEDDPRWQSGFDGDAALWREARSLVLDAVTRDGTFLDIGCATGHLMECLAAWALERGIHLSMYGLELSPDLARAARRRLPGWADRIFEGNIIDWQSPRCFTYVRTGLEYVPAARRSFLVERLLREAVEPGGRLIVGPLSAEDVDDARAAFTAAGVGEPTLRGSCDRNGKTRYVLWAERAEPAEG